MKLQFPFIQLPIAFDAAALAAEVAAVDESEWIPHPQGFPGNSALPLIAVNGDTESDGVEGPMRSTALLERLPYMRQVLGSLGTVLGRTRLMRLSGNAEVTPHVDQAYYWAERMRVHVPVVTTPTVRFHCGDAEINMAAGECWIFDTWRLHRVQNNAETSRIHLVVDTVGGDGLWALLNRGRPHHLSPQGWLARRVTPDRSIEPALEFESTNLPKVMSPWELSTHLNFLFGEVQQHPSLPAMHQSVVYFMHRWRSLWAAHGDAESARAVYQPVLEDFLVDIRRYARDVSLRNGANLAIVLQSMVTKAALSENIITSRSPRKAKAQAVSRSSDPIFDRPVFIVSPPRSGSTLLFETLAQAANVFSIGDESHSLIEGIGALGPAAHNYDSNRLDVGDATEEIVDRLRTHFRAALIDRDGGQPYGNPLRMLEKTPKNSLRIPFLTQVFPEARFVYLHRDVREVLASMLEGWHSGRFVTYAKLPGWSGLPWSFVLTPGWRELVGKPLHEIVAAQWQATTRILLDDLAALPAGRVHVARYDALIADPAAQIAPLCAALDFAWDRPLDRNLPLSRYTLSKPEHDKWRRHQAEIDAVLPSLHDTIARSETFTAR